LVLCVVQLAQHLMCAPPVLSSTLPLSSTNALCPFPLFFLMFPRPPRSPLFPSTTLFRSHSRRDSHRRRRCAKEGCEPGRPGAHRSEEHTSELQSLTNLVCRLLLEKKKKPIRRTRPDSA